MQIPRAGFHDKQASVSGLGDVGRVKVRIFGHQEILVSGPKRGAGALYDMPQYAVWIEMCAEKIAAILRAKAGTSIEKEARRRHARELRHGGHQVSSAFI